MTDHDLNVARAVGALEADMRTVKHDVTQVNSKLDIISNQISTLRISQSRGLGFFAGAAFILTSCLGAMLALGKFLFNGHG